MVDVCTVTGVLSDGRTVVLDEAISVEKGPVRVTVERLPDVETISRSIAVLNDIRSELYASGYQPRAKEDVDAQVQRERNAWDRD
jgi:hypothetical protein